MIREKYEKPIMEVVDLQDDVILTSGGYCEIEHIHNKTDICIPDCSPETNPFCPTDCPGDISPA